MLLDPWGTEGGGPPGFFFVEGVDVIVQETCDWDKFTTLDGKLICPYITCFKSPISFVVCDWLYGTQFTM